MESVVAASIVPRYVIRKWLDFRYYRELEVVHRVNLELVDCARQYVSHELCYNLNVEFPSFISGSVLGCVTRSLSR